MEKHIVFYSDSPIWGGHEIMTAKMANVLKEEYKVSFLFWHKKFFSHLEKDIVKINIPYVTKTPLPFIRNLNFFEISKLAILIDKLNPDAMVISQGTIEFGIKGLISSKLSNVTTISYIPLVYDYVFMKKNKIYKIRDFINQIYYRLPDIFITPAEIQSKILKEKTGKKIFTIENPFDLNIESLKRRFLPTKNSVINIGYLGRLENEQKNIEALIFLAKELRERKVDFKIHIIGDGKDKYSFIELIDKNNLNLNFELYGWKEKSEMLEILKNIDLVVITSYYETYIPLVFMEILYHEIPIMVPDIITFKDIPSDIVYTNIKSLSEKIIKIKKKNFNFHIYESLKYKLLQKFSISKFREDIFSTFEYILKGK